MNDRKQHVINKAHHLFIDKGFQATSIQDILEYSGISKGTFYNYFSSKSELLIAIFKSLNKEIDKDRNEVLIGQNRSDIEIFIKQIEIQMNSNRKYKLMSLFEEVFLSNDDTLKEFMKRTHFMQLRWTFNRFIDIFGEEKKPYLLDCAIMFMGILQLNLHYHFMEKECPVDISKVIRYSVNRITHMVDEVATEGSQLRDPVILEKWLPEKSDLAFQKKLYSTILSLKKALVHHKEQAKFMELLEFLQEELLHAKEPRKFLIQSTISALKENQGEIWQKELHKLERLIGDF
jgi:AcrR family transcriptional regulator